MACWGEGGPRIISSVVFFSSRPHVHSPNQQTLPVPQKGRRAPLNEAAWSAEGEDFPHYKGNFFVIISGAPQRASRF
jgi:hypothetical protein